MHFRTSMTLSVATMAVVAAGIAACSSDSEEVADSISTAASPIVQHAGVMRLRAEVEGNVTRVALLDEGGNGIGTLELTTEAPHRVHARQNVRGHAFEASWSDDGLTFTREGRSPLTVRAGESRSDADDRALLESTSELSIALGVAHDVGAFSLVTEDTSATVRPLSFGTGADDRDKFTGTDWEWGTSSSSWNTAYGASQNAAYNGCSALNSGGGCATFQGATMTTSCGSYGYYTSCSTTITVGACAGAGNCPH